MSYSNQVSTNNTSPASSHLFHQLPRTIKPRDVERDSEGNVVVWNCFCDAIYEADRKRRQDQGLESNPPLIQCRGRAWTNFDEYHKAHGIKTVICQQDGCFSCIPLQPGPINYHLSGDHATAAAEMTGETDPQKIQEALFKLPRLFYDKDNEQWVKDRPDFEKRVYVPRPLDPTVPQITCTQDGCNEPLYLRKKDIVFHCANKHLSHAASLLGLAATTNKADVQKELFGKDRLFFNKRSGSNGMWQLDNPVKVAHKPTATATASQEVPQRKDKMRQRCSFPPLAPELTVLTQDALETPMPTRAYPISCQYSTACKKESVSVSEILQLTPPTGDEPASLTRSVSVTCEDEPASLHRSVSVTCKDEPASLHRSVSVTCEDEPASPSEKEQRAVPPSIKQERKNRYMPMRTILSLIPEDTDVPRSTNEPLTLEEKIIKRPVRAIPDEIVLETSRLEKFCSHGPTCSMRSNTTNPCRQNHVIGLEFLSEGDHVPIHYCKWDYRWNRNQLGKRRRCANRECIYDHAEGHANFWMKKDKSEQSVSNDTEMETLRQELANLKAMFLDKRLVNISESHAE